MEEDSKFNSEALSSAIQSPEKVKELEGQMEAFEIQDESEVMSYYRLREQLSNLSQEFQSWLVKPQYLVPFLQAGRLVRIKHQDKDFGYGTVLSFKKKAIQGKNPMKEGDDCSYAIGKRNFSVKLN